MKTWIPVGLCGLFILSAGCVCAPGGGCGGCQLGPVAYRQASCEPCESGCGPTSGGDFYSGAGPLARFFGVTNCSGGGCGELYVDEWLNEPPQVDDCGYNECLQCGQSPVRSLFQAVLGRQYSGACDSCDCGGSSLIGSGPIVQDGYVPGAWSNQRCVCDSSDSLGYTTDSDAVGETTVLVDPSDAHVQPSIPNIQGQSILKEASPTTPPPPTGSPNSPSKSVAPTPAPSLPPSSASRLNPATRRVMR